MTLEYFGHDDDGDEEWRRFTYPWRPLSSHPIHIFGDLTSNKNSMTNGEIKNRAEEIGEFSQVKATVSVHEVEGILFFDSDGEPYIATGNEEVDHYCPHHCPWQVESFEKTFGLFSFYQDIESLEKVEKTFEYLIPGDVIVQDYKDVFGAPDGFIAEEVINVDRNGEYTLIDTHCGQHQAETPEAVVELTKEDEPKGASNRYTVQELKSRDDVEIYDDFSEEENIEMTLEEVAEKVGVDVDKLRIKDK